MRKTELFQYLGFRLLVQYNQTMDFYEKEFVFSQLIKLSTTHTDKLNDRQLEYYDKWYYSLITALCSVYNFSSIKLAI